MEQLGAGGIVRCVGGDFMDADLSPTGPYADVTHVLIDPSCSGSGLVATYEAGQERAGEYVHAMHTPCPTKTKRTSWGTKVLVPLLGCLNTLAPTYTTGGGGLS